MKNLGHLYLTLDVDSTEGRLFCLFEHMSGFASQYSNVAVTFVFEGTVAAVSLNELKAFTLIMRSSIILTRGRIVVDTVERELFDEESASYIGFEAINTLA